VLANTKRRQSTKIHLV